MISAEDAVSIEKESTTVNASIAFPSLKLFLDICLGSQIENAKKQMDCQSVNGFYGVKDFSLAGKVSLFFVIFVFGNSGLVSCL
ncbi:MAG: hypothetical protein MZW92_54405 [Comamonadaceae bacterium]|nr:hypothetical protein [Comamonadaceae bacterium]